MQKTTKLKIFPLGPFRKAVDKAIKRNLKEADAEWKRFARERDNMSCAICGTKYEEGDSGLHVHHIIPREVTELRTDNMNSICLCFNHHKVGTFSAHNNGLWFMKWLEHNRLEQYQYLMGMLYQLGQENESEGNCMYQKYIEMISI